MRDSNGWKFSISFLIPQTLTGLRIAISAGAILLTMIHKTTVAAKLIPVATVTDILDGPIATKLRVQSDRGALFDYFADYLCYIVAPVVLSCTLLLGSGLGYPVLPLTLPLLTGALRYSRNAILSKNESFAQLGFPGLLTACYALFISGIVLVNPEATLGAVGLKLLLCVTAPTLSLLMVSRIRYPKLTVSKTIGIPVVIFLLCLPLVLTKVLAAFMLCLVATYVVVSPLLIRHSRQRTDGKPVGGPGW